jgi:hypothetical protein
MITLVRQANWKDDGWETYELDERLGQLKVFLSKGWTIVLDKPVEVVEMTLEQPKVKIKRKKT